MKKAVLALVPVALAIPGLVNTAESQTVYGEWFASPGYVGGGGGGLWSSYYINADQGETQVGYDGSSGPIDAHAFIRCIGDPDADGGNSDFYWYGVSGITCTTYWDTLPMRELGYWYTYNGTTSWRYYSFPQTQLYSPVDWALSFIETLGGSPFSGSADALIHEDLPW